MSYILDALKKAESERDLGAVPNLNSFHSYTSVNAGSATNYRAWWQVSLALVVVLSSGFAIRMWLSESTKVSTYVNSKPAKQPVVEEVRVSNQQSSGSDLTALQPLKVMPPASVESRPTKVLADSIAQTPTTKPSEANALSQKADAPRLQTDVTKPLPVQKEALPTVGSIRSASGGIPMLHELPKNVQQQIPPITISGAISSESNSEQLLLINNQVLGVGNLVAPDVRLEEISSASVVFSFKSQRFRVDR
jgi:general secretion pathway protein B